MEALVIRYGVVAILLGAGIEGEPFALIGGVLVHRGWIPWWEAAGAAIAGSCLVDQFWFQIARYLKSSRLIVRIRQRDAFARALALLEAHPVGFVLMFRFAYGLRAVAPVAIGMSRIPTRLFVPLNMASAAGWGALYTALGYLLGAPIESLFARFGAGVAVGVTVVSLGVLALSLKKGRAA